MRLVLVFVLAMMATACAPRVVAPAAFWVQVSGAGRTVVFIPDLEAPGSVWDSTVAHLGGRVEAHVVTVAGFAGVPPVDGPVIARLRDELARYLRAHKKRDVVLVGHMFGATVAYSLLCSDPDRIAGVVAIDALPTVGVGDTASQEAEEGRHDLATADAALFAKMTRHRLMSMMASQTTAARVSAAAELSSPRTTADAFYEMMTLDLRPRLGELRAPILVIETLGNRVDEPRAALEQSWHRQLDRLPRATLLVVPESRHYVMFDAPDVFFRALDAFLISVAGARS